MDKFEQFFRENRLRLDTEDIDSLCSDRIVSSIKWNKRRRVLRQLYVAASLTAVAVLGTLLYLAQNRQELTIERTGVFSDIAIDLVNKEASYIESVNKSVDALKKQKIPVEYETMFKGFTNQLQLIDKQYDLYKAQVEQQGYSEELIRQIIYNYQLKLSVLQMLHDEINKINKLSKNQKHEYKEIQFSI